MTLVDPAVLMEQHADIERRLASATSESDRATLKAEISALYRQADAGVKAFTTLRDQTHRLIEQWKALPRMTPTPVATPRVDHLGASTFIEKGWSRISAGEFVEAESFLVRALELVPEHIEATTLLAWSMMLQGNPARARAVVDDVLKRDASNALGLAISGLVHIGEGDAAGALRVLHRAIAAAEHDRRALLFAHLHSAMAYQVLEQHERAVEHLRTALALGPNLIQAAFELGRSLWMLDRRDDALTTWREAARANKFSPWGKRCAQMVEKAGQGGELLPVG